MKILRASGCLFAALVWASGAGTDTRMQVAAGSASVHVRPDPGAPAIGSVGAGEILFVARVEGAWAAISPPDRISLWLNKDFIENDRVAARSIQVRAGPGVQYEVVGTLSRGDPVLARGEEGDWRRIAPPSSATLWVRRQDLTEIQARAAPIREVVPAPESAPPPPSAPAPIVAATPPAPPPGPPPIAPGLPDPPSVSTSVPAPTPAPVAAPRIVGPVVAAPPPVQPPARAVKIVPSDPTAPAPPPPAVRRVAQPPPTVATPPAPPSARPPAPPRAPVTQVPAPPAPGVAARPKPASPPPATAGPAPAKPMPAPPPATTVPERSPPRATPPPPAAQSPAPAKPRGASAPADTRAVPAPASAVVAQKSQNVAVKVDQAYVDDLELADMPNQGRPVQVEGELRNAPFMAASPSRFRLQDKNADGVLEMICHIHGDAAELRRHVGKGVSIRGREYWVEESDMPVVVAGQIVPLAPAHEPVMF